MLLTECLRLISHNEQHQLNLLRLEKQDSAVAQVEVDEVLRLCCSVSIGEYVAKGLTVSDETAEVASNNAMPGSSFALVKLLLLVLRSSLPNSHTVRLM